MTFVELRHAITLAQEIGVAVEIADYWAGDYAHWRAHVTRTRLQIDWIGQGTFSESLYQSLSTVLAGLPPPRHLESVAITGLEESTSLRDRVETICNRWGVNVHLEN